MVFSQGDIIEVSFDPSVGHEPAKTRPAVVLSSDQFNLMSSMTMVAPITSRSNGYPLHVPITQTDAVWGCVCVEQTRAMDLGARRCRKIGAMGPHDMSEVLNVVGAVFGI